MKPEERGIHYYNNLTSKETMNRVNLKKSFSSSFNKEVLRKASTFKIDPEKAAYISESIWETEAISSNEEELFPRKKINIFKFYFHLFESIDWVFFIFGMIGCVACGVSKPLIYYLNSQIYSDVGNTSEQVGGKSEKEIMIANVRDSLTSGIKKQLIYGTIALADNFIAYFFIGLLGTRCLYTFKKRYFSIIFAQEQAWFDSTNIYEFASKIQAQLEFIENGLGDTYVDLVVKFFICIGCLIFSFFGSWKLALVVFCLVPFLVLDGIILSKLLTKGNNLYRGVYEQAGAIAEEILYNIKIINSFANFDYELKRFSEKTEISAILNIKTIFYNGIALSLLLLGQVLSVFIAIIYGRTIVGNDYNYIMGRDVTGGDINLTFNCAVTLIASTVNFLNDFSDVISSLAASSDYFNLIERKPKIDLTYSIEKPPLSEIQGNIEFNNVDFYYPSDPNKKLILNKINLKFLSGKKTSLIGESGSGKTTVVNLIERLYDRTGGEILIDGIDIKKYDIQYLRNLIGYCEQEPILFNTSIKDNIIFGREEYLQELGQDIDQLVEKACQDAYVTEFIKDLPGGLDYIVGVKGSKLSGGQKQRIAIARSIITNPKILILDEATSALDNKSEKIVQKALDNISKRNITTITIAHKLSTIKNSDLIYVLKDGMVYEQGIHEELLAKGGYYEKTVRPQLLKEELENQNKEEEKIRQLTTVERVDTDEEVHFERRDKELSKSTDDVNLKCCNVIKMLWNYKCMSIFSLIATIIYGAFPVFRGYIAGLGTNALDSKYQTVRYDDGLKYSIIYLIVGILHVISYFFYFHLFYSLGALITKLYRNYLLKKYLSFHIAFFDIDRNSPGSLVTKMSIDTIQLQCSMKLIIGNLITAISCFIVTLIFGVCYEYRITLATIAFIPLLIIITIIRRLTVQVDSPKSLAASTDGGRIISECSTGSKTIFSYNFTQRALRLYLEAIDYITQRKERDNFISAFCLSLLIFCNYLINVVIFALSKKYISDESLTSDDMTVIQIVMGEGLATVCGLMESIWRIRKAIATLRSIYSILDTDSLISPFKKDNIGKISANNIKGKIEFRNVYFAYPFQPEHVILKNISFTILPGQKVALVGNSGCGKSSIIQLINRFYDVEDGKGEILIDDVNIKDYNLYELKKKIGFVQQEPSAFNRSAIENIRYGNLEATDDECYEAAREVNALSVLENKKEKKLPVGDKQKLAIARIFLKNPPILLLDEPTSALDKESEMEIEKSLEILSKNKTTVTIAHRLNTIEKCDKIIVFDNGRIKEQGTHDELMKLKKRYYTLQKFENLG